MLRNRSLIPPFKEDQVIDEEIVKRAKAMKNVM
jgi:hypothetical protein